MNDRLFRSPPKRVHERAKDLVRLSSVFPLGMPRRGRVNAAVVVGESGVGNTSLVEHYFADHLSGVAPSSGQKKLVFFKFDQTTIGSDTSYRGQLADKFNNLQSTGKDLEKIGYRLVVFIDDIHNLVEASWKDNEGSVYRTLPGQLKQFSYDLLATSSPKGWEILENTQTSFTSIMGGNNVILTPLEESNAVIAVRKSLLDQYSYLPSTDLLFSENALLGVAGRLNRMSLSRKLPASLADLVVRVIESKDGKAAMRKIKNKTNKKNEEGALDKFLVNQLSESLGITKILLGSRSEIKTNMDELEKRLKNRVKNQDEAIKAIIEAFRAFALEINAVDKPIARMLFLGPTGVGKTELVLAVVDEVFSGDSQRLLKFSGEDYAKISEQFNPGEMKKKIVNRVKQYPMNVVMFDEMEKMHPDNRNIALSTLDGQIVDGRGNLVRTTMTLFIGTSNLGVQKLKQEVASKDMGFSADGEVSKANSYLSGVSKIQMERIFISEMEAEFSPELVNRFDVKIVFNPIGPEVAEVITSAYLQNNVLTRGGLSKTNITFDKEVINLVAALYVDIAYGARRLTDNINLYLVRRYFADNLLNDNLVDGTNVRISLKAPIKDLAIDWGNPGKVDWENIITIIVE